MNHKQLDHFSQLLRLPLNDMNNKKRHLHNIIKNLDRNMTNKTIYHKKELNKFTRLLKSNSLYTTLNKGYSIVRKSKKIIKKSYLINQKDTINIQFLDKAIDLKIKKN